MKRKIYINMILLSLVSIIIVSGFLSFLFYNKIVGQIKSELKNKCVFIEKALDLSEDRIDMLNQLNLPGSELRITAVSKTGQVIYDNSADITTLENHSDREEIKEAFASGEGESKRFSETIGKETYYYSLKLNEDMVIRVSKTTDSVYGIYVKMLPLIIGMILFIFFICNLIALRLTKRIIDPINQIDIDNENIPYDELSPFIGTIINQKKQLQMQLSELDSRTDLLKSINESMKEGLIILDKNGVAVSANSSARKLLDKSKTIEGRNIIELTRNVQFLEYVKSALDGRSCDMTLNYEDQILNVLFSPLQNGGVLILYVDITEKAKAEKLRHEFSANVSHELKTPLTSILGYAELIENGMVKTEDINGFIKKIKNEARRLISLIADIIRLSEMDEESVKNDIKPFNIKELADDVLDTLLDKAKEHHVSLNIQCADISFKANKQMIFEMLYNLMDNGIKYNKENGEVSLNIRQEKDNIIFIISDSGIGIPKKDINHIFERFYRVDKSRSKKTGGTGLGLSIVKHIINYHNGTIDIESKEGIGTTVIINLPKPV